MKFWGILISILSKFRGILKVTIELPQNSDTQKITRKKKKDGTDLASVGISIICRVKFRRNSVPFRKPFRKEEFLYAVDKVNIESDNNKTKIGIHSSTLVLFLSIFILFSTQYDFGFLVDFSLISWDHKLSLLLACMA